MTTAELELARATVAYDPDTGVFTSLETGRIVTYPHGSGYLRVCVARRDYLAHRLAWLLVHGKWPPKHIDHINGDKTDNRLCNIRPVEVWQNRANSRKGSGKSSRLKGVSRRSDCDRWAAKVSKQGVTYRLGLFTTEEAAHAAYVAKARELFGDYARFE